MNPLAAICHVVAIVAGAWGGVAVISAIAPDLPPAGAQPAVTADPQSEPIEPQSPDSFLHATGFAAGLGQISDQIAAGDDIRRLRVEADSIQADSTSGDGLIPIGEIPADSTQNLISAIGAERPAVSYDQIAYMELFATANGPRWFVQLLTTEPGLGKPSTFTASISGEPVKAGGPAPVPIGG